MEKEEIKQRLHTIIDGLKSPWNDMEITDTSDLREDIGLESIDFLDMILQTETMFNIKITPEEASSCKMVSDFVSLVEQKVNIQHSSLNMNKDGKDN